VLYQDQIKLPMVRKDGYTGSIRKEYPLKAADVRVWTQEEVDSLLEKDLGSFTRGVIRMCGSDLSPGQLGALTSFAFNAGLGALQRSQIRQRHLRGDYEGAAEAFMMWTKGGGKELPGLVKRRKDERALYLS
jgi:lysozyme